MLNYYFYRKITLILLHKIFAKPLFFGKKVLFLPQCHSTNEELLTLAKKSNEPEGFVLYTDHQEKGRGQRGNVWIDEPGKNILMSILLKPSFLNPSNQYFLNLIVGLSVVDVLRDLIPMSSYLLKWPNDIYVDDKKLGGILIESSLKGTKLEYSVLGIGMNVNQSGFNLLNATSLFLETKNQFNRFELMESLLQHLEKWYLKLKEGKEEMILAAYHEKLLWKDEVHTFRIDNRVQEGIIRGIDKQGRLMLGMEAGDRLFNIKEIEFLS